MKGKRAAIIVAGGDASSSENKLRDTIDQITSFVYDTFYERRFVHSEIYFVSAKSWVDFNNDGLDDTIVDAPVTISMKAQGISERNLTTEDIRQSFEWAKSKGRLDHPLYFYFVDHGGDSKLMLSAINEITAQELDNLITDYQTATGNTVVIVVDACHSGSLIPVLSGDNRVVITSAAADEKSYYVNDIQSFSQAFFVHMLGGDTLLDAFEFATNTLHYEYSGYFKEQNPQLDDSGDGVADDLDGEFLADTIALNGSFKVGDFTIALEPVGGDRTVQTGDRIDFEVKTNTAEGAVKKVWAVVSPPYPDVVYDDLGTPIINNPTFQLSDIDGDKTYTGNYRGFNCAGSYIISFFAKDYKNHLATSRAITVEVQGDPVCQPIETPGSVTTGVYTSQNHYQQGETIVVEVKNQGSGLFDQYTALGLPDSTLLFITEENNFTPDTLPWSSTPRMDNIPVRVMNLPLLFEIPKGTYWAYQLLVPAGANIFEAMDQW
ncbi:MAG: C13 family peptidase, partial [Thermodesulfobacteriota bacterium]|nr:C13 family peptidase [Thermodesulfobacteriota bacterium]